MKLRKKIQRNYSKIYEVNSNLENVFIEDIVERYYSEEYFDEEKIKELNEYVVQRYNLDEAMELIEAFLNNKSFLYEDTYEFDWQFDISTWLNYILFKIFNLELEDLKKHLEKFLIILIPHFDKKFYETDYRGRCEIKDYVIEKINLYNKDDEGNRYYQFDINDLINNLYLLSTKNQKINSMIEILLKNNFDILKPLCNNCNWLYFGYLNPDDDIKKHKVFCVELDLFNEYTFSIKYIPNKKYGGGAMIKESIENMKNKNIKSLIPKFINKNKIKFYNDLNDFLEKQKKFDVEYKVIQSK